MNAKNDLTTRSIIYDLIKREEGVRNNVYTDTEGFATIGVGFLVDDRKEGSGLSDEEIEWIFNRRLEQQERAVHNRWPWYYGLNDVRQAVVMSMVWQLGLLGFARFTKTMHYLEIGDYEKAADEMLDSKWAIQTPERANRQAEMMRKGE